MAISNRTSPSTPPTTDPNFLGLFTPPNLPKPITLTIATHLPTTSLVALSRTCRALSPLLNVLTPHLFSPTRHLSRFFTHPATFLATLRATSAVVSGSFALQFFLRTVWVDGDVDVLIRGGTGLCAHAKRTRDEAVETMVAFLEAEGYEWASDTGVYGCKGLDVVKTFFGPPHYSAAFNSPKIQLVVLNIDPVVSVLESYYATHIMNFITGDAAYCLFPKHTLEYIAYLTRDPGFYAQFLEEKYGHRGFERDQSMVGWDAGDDIFQWSPEQRALRSEDRRHLTHARVVRRQIGDAATWMIPFSRAGNDKAGHDGVLGTKFDIGLRMLEDFAERPGEMWHPIRTVEYHDEWKRKHESSDVLRYRHTRRAC